MGAVAYIRAERGDDLSVSFVGARSKLASIVRDTIPHAELKAARIGTDLERKFRAALRLQVAETVFWVDSEAVLHWLRSPPNKNNPRYVSAHRDAIQKISFPHQWRYVPSHLNPADDITRGVRAKDMSRDHRFLRGPEFLMQASSKWPDQPDDIPYSRLEEKMVCVATIENPILQLIEAAQSLPDLKRKVGDLVAVAGSSAIGTVENLHQALLECVKAVQKHDFHFEIKELEANRQIPRASRLRKLGPYLASDGLLRVEGRLGRAKSLSESQRHPIILPPEGNLTKLIILDSHNKLMHASVGRTLFEVRLIYWVLRGRQTVRRIIGGCVDCKRRYASAQQPRMAPLPEERVSAFQPVFFNTGLDYLGPLYVNVKRSLEKRCLFTCLSTRAVHLELASDLSAASFLNAFAIFVSIRGRPHSVYSDNGTNLTAGERELREGLERVMRDPSILSDLAEDGISWKFNPPGAPHMGGSWERLVRSVKSALYVSIGDHPVKEDVLRTALAAIASLINGRPLTDLGVDPDDLRPLTPNHFLIGRENRNMAFDVFEEARGSLDRNRFVAAQQLTNQLWRRWLLEYLPGLTERHKWAAKTRRSEVGDVVLIVDQQAPRGQWLTGRIVRVFPGKDEEVRTVAVEVAGKEFRRPVSRLVLLRAAEEVE